MDQMSDPPTSPQAPSLQGKRFSLAPLMPEHHAPLYRLVTSEHANFRWRYRGEIPPIESFERTLHSNVLVQFAIVAQQDRRRFAGLVVAYNYVPRDTTCYLAVVTDPACGGGTLEATGLFVRYLFACWPLRKIYIEAADFNIRQYASGLRSGLLVSEGLLKEHHYFDDRYWDLQILAIYREAVPGFRSRLDTQSEGLRAT